MQVVLSPDWQQGIHDLAGRLTRELQSGRQVLWLLSGGSNIAASVQIIKLVPKELSGQLRISLADERYGPVGHDDSNWAQLLRAGFEAKDAKLEPLLEAGKSFEETVSKFEALIAGAFANRVSVIAQLGIGDDGHIAGILPKSAGAEPTDKLAVGYRSDPFTRISLSFTAIRRLTAGYAFAFGASKRAALTSLIHTDLPLAEQPAQILKQLNEAYVYNDQVGG